MVEACLVHTTAAVDVIDLMYFCDEVAPLIQAAAGTVLGCLVERLPVGLAGPEEGNVLVWLAGYPGRSAYAPAMSTRGWISGAIAAWPGLCASPRVLRLQATAGSPLTATSGSCFRPIYLVSERAGCLDGGADR